MVVVVLLVKALVYAASFLHLLALAVVWIGFVMCCLVFMAFACFWGQICACRSFDWLYLFLGYPVK